MPIASVKFGFEFLSINQKLNTVFQTVFFWGDIVIIVNSKN